MESESNNSVIKQEENAIDVSLAIKTGSDLQNLADKREDAQDRTRRDSSSSESEQADKTHKDHIDNRETPAATGKQTRLSPKSSIYQRSQSSPSSLTTHKFGLRPTPSPPRLIIDHQTGDIVESYPDQPVYLRTYQPLDDDLTDGSGQLEDSLAHPNPPPLSNRRQLEQYRELLAEQYGQAAIDLINDPAVASSSAEASMSGADPNRQYSPYRPAIPPPHSGQSGKGYFVPPAGGHLFHQGDSYEEEPQQQPASLSGGHNASFKRALNKLNECKTDIALLEEPEGQQRGLGDGQMRITATSAARANMLLSQQKQQQTNPGKQNNKSMPQAAKLAHHQLQQQPQQQHQHHKQQQINNHKGNIKQRIRPSIEDFSLYNFCYIFHILLIVLVSSLIIYLFVVPLNLECRQHQTAHTYVSIIVASVNLICICIFTLIWYCNGVTRTLYANLSSSAFIISIYLILVAVNLALAILFFLSNTCHSQRLQAFAKSTGPSLISHHHDESANSLALPMISNPNHHNQNHHNHHLEPRSTNQLVANLPLPVSVAFSRNRKENEARHSMVRRQVFSSSGGETGETVGLPDEPRLPSRPLDGGQPMVTNQRDPQLHDVDLQLHEQELDHQQASLNVSPIEALWELAKEQLIYIKRKFYLFLSKYDLNFVGALHLVCAVCLFYLAMRVAVVRSYFCSPVGAYA